MRTITGYWVLGQTQSNMEKESKVVQIEVKPYWYKTEAYRAYLGGMTTLRGKMFSVDFCPMFGINPTKITDVNDERIKIIKN